MAATGTRPATIASLLSEANVHLGMEAADKASLISNLVSTLSSSVPEADLEQVTRDVLARESMLSTGVGYGVALPHAKTSALEDTWIAFGTAAVPVEFDSFDGEPVRLIFLIVGPKWDSGRHIQMLGRVSRILNDERIRSALTEAETAGEVIAVLESAEASLHSS